MDNNEFHLKVIGYFFDTLKIVCWPLILLIITLLFRKPIYDILIKLRNFKINTKLADIEMNSTEYHPPIPQGQNLAISSKNVINDIDTQPDNIPTTDNVAGTQLPENTLSRIFNKIKNGDINTIEDEFNRFIATIEDPLSIINIKSHFYYKLLLNNRNGDYENKIINLFNISQTDDEKFASVFWYELYLTDYKNYDSAIKFYWDKINSFNSEISRTIIIDKIASLYILNQQIDKASDLVEKRLNEVNTAEELSKLYIRLSAIEKIKGNANISALCLDKAVEYKPNDAEMIFNSAYEAGNANMNFVGICNYETLIDIDYNKEDSLNNLAVSADNEDLKSISSKYYKMAIDAGSSLAMTNKGYKFLEIGFIKEAEDIAKEALIQNEPHPNAYSLLKSIEDLKEHEFKAWVDIKQKALIKQKLARRFTQAYFKKIGKNIFSGNWVVNESTDVTLSKDSHRIEFSWETISISYGILNNKRGVNHSISGIIHNESFQGSYTTNNEFNSLLSNSLNKSIRCLGFFDVKDQTLTIFSELLKDDIHIILQKTSS